jgi:aspartyl/asparaginyl beta-hydroxylase (cupin superfamily)
MHDWDEGHEVLIFDDGYEHEVWVRSETERSVLIIDFWHPDLTAAERWALQTTDLWTPDRRRYRSKLKHVVGPKRKPK